MRRLAVLVLVALLAVPGTAVGQSPEPDDAEEALAFITISGNTRLGDLMLEGAVTREERAAIREEIAAQKAALLEVDPSECWIELYMGYWDAMTLIDVALDVYDASIEASTYLVGLSNERMQGLDPETLVGCM